MTDYVRPFADKDPVSGVNEDGIAVFLANPSTGALYTLTEGGDVIAALTKIGIMDSNNSDHTLGVNVSGEAATFLADGSNVALGATDDAAAGTDTGTFSLIALFKRALDTHLKAIKANTAAGALEDGGVLDTIKTSVDAVAQESGGNLDTLVAALGAVSAAAWNLTDASTTVIALLKECALLLNDIKTNTTTP